MLVSGFHNLLGIRQTLLYRVVKRRKPGGSQEEANMKDDGTRGDDIAFVKAHGPLEEDCSDQASQQVEQKGGACTTQ